MHPKEHGGVVGGLAGTLHSDGDDYFVKSTALGLAAK